MVGGRSGEGSPLAVLQGMALFVFIPLVLWLFLAQPMGPGWSLVLGIRNTLWVFRLVGAWWLLAAGCWRQAGS